MELFFVISNNGVSKSIIKIEKKINYQIIPIIVNEDLKLEEIQFIGSESPDSIVCYLSKYFRHTAQAKSLKHAYLMAGFEYNERFLFKSLLINILFPGLGFSFLNQKIPALVIFICQAILFFLEKDIFFVTYFSIILVNIFYFYKKLT